MSIFLDVKADEDESYTCDPETDRHRTPAASSPQLPPQTMKGRINRVE